MSTCTIILPIEKRRSLQLLTLLAMFSKNAIVPLRDITQVIPKSTFYTLLYKLKLLDTIVKQKLGFELFTFESKLDFSSMKELKADFDALKEMKVMKANAVIEVTELDGMSFVVFSKSLPDF